MMRLAGVLLLLAVAGASPAAADCAALHEKIRAFSADPGTVADAQALNRAVIAEPTCDGAYRETAGRVIAYAVLRGAQASGEPDAETVRAIAALGRPWPVLAALGDAEYAAGRYVPAVQAYEEALDDLRDVKRNPKAPPRAVEERLAKRAYQARALAPSFVAMKRGFRGGPAGIANVKFRTFTAESVPVPIRFDYDSARLTPDGEKAVLDIKLHLAAEGAKGVLLIGHTDPRGSDSYNDRLSLARAQAVAEALTALGYGGRIDVKGAGKRERFVPDDPGAHDPEQLFAFDRRVEFQITP
jgi:outer membrane protein OmpA-like peptidoglycan-associated protein